MKKKIIKLMSLLVLLVPIVTSSFSLKVEAAEGDDAIEKVDVILHKQVFDAGKVPVIENTGEELDMNQYGGEPLEGVTFEAFDITDKFIELLKAGSSAEEATKTIVELAKNYNEAVKLGDSVKKMVTDAAGTAPFADLPMKKGKEYATYLFVETNSAANIKEKAAPIVVTMPIYLVGTNDVNKNVHIYPKNERDKMLEKDLTEETKKQLEITINGEVINNIEIGKPFEYGLSALLPWNLSDKAFYRIIDTPGAGMKVLVDTIEVPGLEKGVDYTVEAKGDGFVLSLDTKSEKVLALAGKRLGITYKAILTEDVQIDFGANNTANVEVGTDVTGEPEDPTDPPTTGPDIYTGGKQFKKVDNNSGKTLAGAKFDLVKLDKDDNIVAYAYYADGKYEWKTEKPTESIYVSDNDGLVKINGLEYSEKLEAGQTYALIETEAPTGYAKLEKPVKFEVIKGDYATVFLDVKNVKKGILPSTGGSGIYLFLVIGSLLMIGAFVWYRRTHTEVEV